ncbi:hypothetical protein [Pseudalkalibacillus sp. SCS-8]|uniref:hypothetical protein n=1 Tax=Pseudalkalibacillus nanhaiensis TaxID=3115291 RepID=UPI0032DA77DF
MRQRQSMWLPLITGIGIGAAASNMMRGKNMNLQNLAMMVPGLSQLLGNTGSAGTAGTTHATGTTGAMGGTGTSTSGMTGTNNASGIANTAMSAMSNTQKQ